MQPGGDLLARCCAPLAAGEGIRLRLRVTPKSRREGPQGFVATPEGELALKLGINAAPEDGKANAAIVALLARNLAVAKAAISVVAGAKDRRKLVDIRGEPAMLIRALAAWAGPIVQQQEEAEKS